MSRRVAIQKLTRFCSDCFVKAGLRPEDARIVADVLVMTDSWGTLSHGTGALPNYVRALRAGGIDPAGRAEVIAEGASWAVVDGHAGMGMPACVLAMGLAMEKARSATIAWAGVKNSSHFGAAGYYANMAAGEDMIGIAMSNADPNMVVPGGRGNIIGNNPLAYAVPAEKHYPILLDVALSAVAAGKIFTMKTLGQPIPPTWLTDAEGLPTSEVGDWPKSGSMTPMAGHKGYGIALLVEVIAGVLTSSGVLDECKSWVLSSHEKASLGQAFLVINVGAILPIVDFKQRVDSLIDSLHEAPKAKGSERIYVPGELEWHRRKQALKDGVELPEHTFDNLRSTGKELGVEIQLLD